MSAQPGAEAAELEPWAPPGHACTWQRLSTDEATALALVEELAGALELRPVQPGQWRIGSAWTPLFGYLLVRRDDAANVSLGLYFVEDVDEHVGCGLSLLCLVLGALNWLLAFMIVGKWSPIAALVLSPVWLMLPAVGVFKVDRAIKLGRIRRASDRWRQRWTRALAARLVPGPPYR